jgi:S-(hydroxymethyl)glutathione dehydrogenase/alcohol dehydrogenase
MKVRAWVLREYDEPLEDARLELRPPGPGEVLVEIAVSGVCHSDLHAIHADLPLPVPVVLGHEASGVIRGVGPGVPARRIGERVVLSWIPSCGECAFCLAGEHHLCTQAADATREGRLLTGSTPFTDGTVPVHTFSMTGTLAEFTVVPSSGAIPIPPGVPLEVAALFGCAVLTGVGAALRTGQVRPGHHVAVFGAGGVGLNIVAGALLAGAARVIVLDRVPDRLHLAQRLGATHVVDVREEDPVQAVLARTDGFGADVAFEAVGTPETIAQAFNAARRGGTAVVVGVAPPHEEVSLNAFAFPSQGKTLKGSWYGDSYPARDIPALAQLYLSGRLHPERLIARRYTRDEVPQAFMDLQDGRVGRPVVIFRHEEELG